MKITDLKMYHITPRWLFLKIETDAGICGWGEAVVEARARTVETAVNELRPILIGADPLKIEHLWQLMYRGTYYRGGPVFLSAISGVEQALWDIKGKYYNAPVYELLGGAVRNKVRMYGHLKPTALAGDFPIESMLEIADQRLADGFDVVKYSIIPPIRIRRRCSRPFRCTCRAITQTISTRFSRRCRASPRPGHRSCATWTTWPMPTTCGVSRCI
jgi:galactonate dehydratase